MIKIIFSYNDKEPGCAVYELLDARQIQKPVPASMDYVDKIITPVEGREYYTRVKEIHVPEKIFAGVAKFAGREIPCRETFVEISETDGLTIQPEGEYAKFVCLEKIGGSAWASPDRSKRRVYFNVDIMAKAIGLDVSFYNTGNVSSAKLKGEKISNGRATKMLSSMNSTKLWFDADDDKFHSKGDMDTDQFNEIAKWIKGARSEQCPGVFK